jgi:hypothetical protein
MTQGKESTQSKQKLKWTPATIDPLMTVKARLSCGKELQQKKDEKGPGANGFPVISVVFGE